MYTINISVLISMRCNSYISFENYQSLVQFHNQHNNYYIYINYVPNIMVVCLFPQVYKRSTENSATYDRSV